MQQAVDTLNPKPDVNALQGPVEIEGNIGPERL